MKKLLYILLLVFFMVSCKKDRAETCGTCQYRKLTKKTTGGFISDAPVGGSFNVCGNDTISTLTHYNKVILDSNGLDQTYTIYCNCF